MTNLPAIHSAATVAQLEQAQWAIKEPRTRGSRDLIEEEWGYAFNPAVPMIYGGYLL